MIRGNISINVENIFKYSNEFNNISSFGNIEEFSVYIDLKYKDVKSRLKRVWGLMTVVERNDYLYYLNLVL